MAKMNPCPGCNGPLSTRFNEYHDKEMAYCPECGWDEEDGGNYCPPAGAVPDREDEPAELEPLTGYQIECFNGDVPRIYRKRR